MLHFIFLLLSCYNNVDWVYVSYHTVSEIIGETRQSHACNWDDGTVGEAGGEGGSCSQFWEMYLQLDEGQK